MNRFVAPFALLLLLAWPAASARAHYVDLAGRLAGDGVLTVGIGLVGRPFSYRAGGVLQGFEIDLATAVARSRGLEVRFVKLPRADLAAALAAGAVDLINSFALAEGADAAIGTVPYLIVGDHAMVLKGNPFRVDGIESLAGHTVAATAGSSAEAFAIAINARLAAAGLSAMRIHSFPYQRDTHFPVSMGHAAAYFVHSASAVAPGLDPDSRVRPIEGLFQPRREVGFGVLPANGALRDAVVHAIAAQVATGQYERLRTLHGLPGDLSPFRDDAE